MISTSIKPDNGLSRATSPQGILQSVLAGLNEGRISKVVEQFDELFTFDDHALGLEFPDKERLTEFFQKSREHSLRPPWKWIRPASAEITPLLNGSLRQRRVCPLAQCGFEVQFPCEVHRSCKLRTEESFGGPTTTTA